MSSTKKVRFALPLVMAVAAAAPTVVAVAAVTVAAVMPEVVATAAVVMVVVAVVVVPVVAVAAVAAVAVVTVSYGLAQSASNKELLTAQDRPPGCIVNLACISFPPTGRRMRVASLCLWS